MKASFANSGLSVSVSSLSILNPVAVSSGIKLNRIQVTSVDGFIRQQVAEHEQRIEQLETDVFDIQQKMIIFDDLGE